MRALKEFARILLMGSILKFSVIALRDSLCQGSFVNPITDVCWDCMFPLTLGNIAVVSSSLPDTSNPGDPICVCKQGGYPRIGIAFGYWEPFAMEDVTKDPMCFVNIGGITMPISGLNNNRPLS